jgi:hypothetical protein
MSLLSFVGYRGNPLLTLLRGMESSIEIADAQRIATRVRELNTDISTLGEIRGLPSGIETALRKAVGHTYGSSVNIEFELHVQIGMLVDGQVNILRYVPDSGRPPIRRPYICPAPDPESDRLRRSWCR